MTRRSARLAALGVLLVTSAPVQGTVEEQEPVPAVWREHKLSFHYTSSLAVYTCHALKGRVADLLRAVGARDDIRVSANHCDESMTAASPGIIGPGGWSASRPMSEPSYAERRPDRSQQRQNVVVLVTLMMPTEVTPEVLAELEKDKERRELIARVSGNPAARFNDPVIFPAERQQVTLSRKTVKLQPHECELVDQMSTTVFRELGVNIVRKNANCDRTQASLMPPEVVVESLMAARPKPAQDDPEEAEAEQPAAPAPTATPATPEASKPPGQ